MKLNAIRIQNILGVRAADITIATLQTQLRATAPR